MKNLLNTLSLNPMVRKLVTGTDMFWQEVSGICETRLWQKSLQELRMRIVEAE